MTCQLFFPAIHDTLWMSEIALHGAPTTSIHFDRRIAGEREQYGALFSACFEFASIWAGR